MYVEAMHVIEAQEQMRLISAISYPQTKKEHQQKQFRDLRRQAMPPWLRKKEKPLSPEQVLGILNG